MMIYNIVYCIAVFFLFWNIHGLSKDTFTFLLYYLPMYDITALCETGLNLTPLVFHYLMHLPRKKLNRRAKRGSAGILIFTRKEIYKHVELVNLSDEDDRQCLKLNLKGESELIYMGIWYIPPQSSTGEAQLSNKWNLLVED